MEFPKDLKYSSEHEWVRIDGDQAEIGITEFAAQELGDIVYIELPALGKALKAGETVCVVESTKAASDVYTPVSGRVLEVNNYLSSSPETINSDPYSEGWMVKLDKINQADLSKLMDAKQYSKFLGDKI